MEMLADSGMLEGVIDVTTTEIADELSAASSAPAPTGSAPSPAAAPPYVGACGALDMVNFWAPETIPARFEDARFYRHNPNVTLMRTTAEECRAIGAWIAARLNACSGPVRFLIPSAASPPSTSRAAPSTTPPPTPRSSTRSRRSCNATADRRLVRLPLHINDPDFADALVAAWREIARRLTMPAIPRADILKRFRAMVAAGQPIIGGGAGTGLSAKCEEAGGIDLIVIYNSGRYRMAGRGSAAGLLAFGNANEIVKEMAAEVLPVVRHTPVLAGVNGTDPFLLLGPFLRELKDIGFSGVQNFPTIGLFDGTMRTSLRGDRHGLRPRGRHDRRRPRARPADHALRLQPRRGARHDPRRRRHRRRPHGGDHRRLHRRHLRPLARRLRRRDRRHRRAPPAPSATTSSSSATAARSPMPEDARLRPASTPRPATASTAPPAWSACRSSGR